MIDEVLRSVVLMVLCVVAMAFWYDTDRTREILQRHKDVRVTRSGNTRLVGVAQNYFANFFGLMASLLCAFYLVATLRTP